MCFLGLASGFGESRPAPFEVQLSTRARSAVAFYRNRDSFMGVVAVPRDHHRILSLAMAMRTVH